MRTLNLQIQSISVATIDLIMSTVWYSRV